ncbi:tyramine oxidase subunit B [Millisia brevis]|uniref:tyramine oxidase subunit B n=1 Tax=Millisia brevis TaxID=264148 RepID=UPI0009FCCD8A|nr:tyramine oxidase subunit B [Millisia brevis]
MSTEIDFRYLSEPDMIAAGVTDMPACVDAMEEALVLLHRGDYRMAGAGNDSHGSMVVFPEEATFPGMPTNTPDRRLMAMPAYLGGSFGTCGVKWYGSNIANREKGLPRSILMFLLSDVDTGAPLALMSANLLSAYRTGAVPGVGARHLARPDATTVGIVGPGVMARTSLAAFVAARPGIETVKILGRGRESLEKFEKWVGEQFPDITVIETDSIEATVRDSDIVTFCTSGPSGDPSGYPTAKREWVKPGAFLSMPSLCEVDSGLCEPDVRKVLDSYGLYNTWLEEEGYPSHHEVPMVGCKFIDMVHDGKLDRDELVDIGAIAAGDVPGRRSDDEIVIFSVGGMPIEDVAWGTTVYRRAVDQGIGVSLNLWESPALA